MDRFTFEQSANAAILFFTYDFSDALADYGHAVIISKTLLKMTQSCSGR